MSDPLSGRPPLPATRVDDAAREVAVRVLSDAFGRGQLTMTELDARMDRVYRAFRHDELQAVIQDLAPAGQPAPLPLPVAPRRIRAVLSNVEQSRITTMPAALRIEVWLGNVELDLRQTEFPPGVTEVDIRATLGNVELTLPPHVLVENDGGGVLGSFAVNNAPLEPGSTSAAIGGSGPVVRITGRSILSNVEIHHARR